MLTSLNGSALVKGLRAKTHVTYPDEKEGDAEIGLKPNDAMVDVG